MTNTWTLDRLEKVAQRLGRRAVRSEENMAQAMMARITLPESVWAASKQLRADADAAWGNYREAEIDDIMNGLIIHEANDRY